MLNHITDPTHFEDCIKYVKKTYWPYENEGDKQKLFERFEKISGNGKKPIGTTVDGIQRQIDDVMSAFFTDTCQKEKLYRVVGAEEVSFLPIPFLSKFHTLFAKRKWGEPYCQPSAKIEDLLRLAPGSIKDGKIGNYSAHYGDYCHFVNVVAALSHLIYFFSDRKQNGDAVWLDQLIGEGTWDIIKYPTDVCVRKFKLMLAGFYHDIGKTVVDHRHAMEGYIILSSYQSNVLRDILLLAKGNRVSYNLDREDLLFIADMVYYHDLYGTLSTGENGYVRLISLIERIERYCRKEGKETLLKTGKQLIFDLWLLNVADILVSVKNKWKLQSDWVDSKLDAEEAEAKIKNFFENAEKKIDGRERTGNFFIDQGHDLLHDLKITFDLFEIYVNDQFTNSQLPFKPTVLKCSYYHNVARIRKLVKNSLFPKVVKLLDGVDHELTNQQSGRVVLRSFYENIAGINRYALDKTIETSIRSGTDHAEFFKRFSWIGQLDYSLGFFRKLSEHAIDKITTQMGTVLANHSMGNTAAAARIEWMRELLKNTSGHHTGWISDDPSIFDNQLEEWGKINSRYFVDNYVEIVVQIINYLLFRDPFNEHVLNFEFEDAGKRLTEDKINRILFFEGPARSTKSTMLILETVFIY